jgi:quercetin dioxygenase-like cupin family protein
MTDVPSPNTHTKEKQMEIKPKQPTAKGPVETFTGDVWVDAIANGEEPSRVRVNLVRFSPGARSAWHSHVLGQTLHVTEGAGLAQSRGGDIVKIRAGDVIYTPADEEHWHGATPDDFMAHLSITEGVVNDEKPEANWGARVTDAEYHGQAQ